MDILGFEVSCVDVKIQCFLTSTRVYISPSRISRVFFVIVAA